MGSPAAFAARAPPQPPWSRAGAPHAAPRQAAHHHAHQLRICSAAAASTGHPSVRQPSSTCEPAAWQQRLPGLTCCRLTCWQGQLSASATTASAVSNGSHVALGTAPRAGLASSLVQHGAHRSLTAISPDLPRVPSDRRSEIGRRQTPPEILAPDIQRRPTPPERIPSTQVPWNAAHQGADLRQRNSSLRYSG